MNIFKTIASWFTSNGDRVRYLGDMQRLQMQPGDVLVLSCDDYISDDVALRLKNQFESRFEGTRCMVLSGGLRAGVINMGEPPSIVLNPPDLDRTIARPVTDALRRNSTAHRRN